MVKYYRGDDFHQNTLIIGMIIWTLTAVFVIYNFQEVLPSIKFPPKISQCPDYYSLKDFSTTGTDTDQKIQCHDDFEVSIGDPEDCEWFPVNGDKKAFLTKCDMTWEGVDDD
jgi:hypothetical protein